MNGARWTGGAIGRAVLCLCLAHGTAGAVDVPTDAWRIAPTPDWVEPVAPFSAPGVEDDTPRGVNMRLSSRQYDARTVGRGVVWHAHEREFLTRGGVENGSGIAIDFDPTYQRLALHEVTIRRGARTIDKLPTLRADVLRRERDLDALIYDGSHTLNLLIDDVRVGDVLRYAFSVAGENPILGGHREITVVTDRGEYPVGRSRTRLLTSVERPFHVRSRGTDVAHPTVRRGDVLETVVDQADPPERVDEAGAPAHLDGAAVLVFGDLPDWRSVVDWATPLYPLDDDAPPELVRVAADIRAAHPDDEAARIGAALHWVQEEIRYFGIELGRDSHLPARPAETLARRFGDCKGKTLLLVALLAELGVAAEPALVDTTREIAGEDFPWRLHAFDHVIVHVAGDTRSHWLDPTRAWQRGALGDFHEPDYGRALVLADGESEPRDMANPTSGWSISVDKHLALPADRTAEATLEVRTVRRGRLVEDHRRRVETDGLASLGERYTDYYRGEYRGEFAELRQIAVPVVEREDAARSETLERYAIDGFWWAEDDIERYRWLWGDEVLGWFDEAPDTDGRTWPFALTHPLDLVETWHVSLPERAVTDDLDAVIATPWFAFEKSHALDDAGTALTVTMRYRTLVPEVAAADLARYAEAIAGLEDVASFYVEDRRPVPPGTPPSLGPTLDGFVERLDALFGGDAEGASVPEGDPVVDAEDDGWTVRARVEFGGMGGAALAAGFVALRRRRERRPSTGDDIPCGSEGGGPPPGTGLVR